MTKSFLSELRTIDNTVVLEDTADTAPHLRDWRKRQQGRALAVVLPGSTAAVASVVALCAQHGVPLYPQGGNTSLCGGSVPDESGNGIVVNLRRMNKIRSIAPNDNSMIVDAGCVLAVVQEAARSVDRLFPLSLGAEGSCQIGGNIATNAGGIAVVRYGNTRELVLGIEAVLPDGTIWNGLRTLRKNNTGYDLKHLFIGSEGTLGIVTGAALKLFPRPANTITAFVAMSTIENVSQLAVDIQTAFPGIVSAIELLSASELELVFRHVRDTARPLSSTAPWYVLVELAGSEDEAVLSDRFMELLQHALETGAASDATIAASERQREQLWQLRHHIAEANSKEGMGITLDIAVPPAKIPLFVNKAQAALRSGYPDAMPVVVGHLGDGNLHYIAMFSHADWAAVDDKRTVTANLKRLVFDIAVACGGTFSAEHGIGSAHLAEMARYKDAAELALMRQTKEIIDPQGIMNPGRLLPPSAT